MMILLLLLGLVGVAEANPFLLGSTAPSLEAPDQGEGLILYYDFEDGAGTTVTDRTGNGHTATITNGTPVWTAGVTGSALQYTASGATQTTSVTALNFGSRGFTVLFYYKGAGSNAAVISKWENSASAGDPNYGWAIRLQANGSLWLASSTGFYGDNANAIGTGTGVVPVDSTWHHIAVVRDHPGFTRFYVDGVLHMPKQPAGSSPTMFSGAIADGDVSNTTNLEIGSQACTSTACNNGQGSKSFHAFTMDELKIYSRALTTSEVQAVMNNESLPAASRFATLCDTLPATIGSAATTSGTGLLWCEDFSEPERAVELTGGHEEIAGIETQVVYPTVIHDPLTTRTGTGGGSMKFTLKGFEQVRTDNPSLTRTEAYHSARGFQPSGFRVWMGDRTGNIWGRSEGQSTFEAFGPTVTAYIQFRFMPNRAWFTNSIPKLGFGMGAGCRKYNGVVLPQRCVVEVGGSDSMEAVTLVPFSAVSRPLEYNFPPLDPLHETATGGNSYHGSEKWQLSQGWDLAVPNSTNLFQPGYSFTRGTFDGTTWVGGCKRSEINPLFGGQGEAALTQCKTLTLWDEWREVTIRLQQSGNWTGHRNNRSVDIATVTVGNPNTTIVTTIPHDWDTGDRVVIGGTTGLTGVNSVAHTIARVDDTTFTIPVNTEGQTPGGNGKANWTGPHIHDNRIAMWIDGVNILNLDNHPDIPPFRADQPTPAECAAEQATKDSRAAPSYTHCHTANHLWRASSIVTTGVMTATNTVSSVVSTARIYANQSGRALRLWSARKGWHTGANTVTAVTADTITLGGSLPSASWVGLPVTVVYVRAVDDQGFITPQGPGDGGATLGFIGFIPQIFQRGNVPVSWCHDHAYTTTTTGFVDPGNPTKITAVASESGFVVGQRVTTNARPTLRHEGLPDEWTHYMWSTPRAADSLGEFATITEIAGTAPNVELTLDTSIHAEVTAGTYEVRTGPVGTVGYQRCGPDTGIGTAYNVNSFKDHPTVTIHLDDYLVAVNTPVPMNNGQLSVLPYECNAQAALSVAAATTKDSVAVAVASGTGISDGDTVTVHGPAGGTGAGGAGFATGHHFATVLSGGGTTTLTLDRAPHFTTTGQTATLRAGGSTYRACLAP